MFVFLRNRGFPVTAAFWLAASLAACDATSAPCAPGPDSDCPGHVRFALDAALCADHCVTTFRVTLFEDGLADLPLGPAVEAACLADVALVDLPAGLFVRVVIDAFDSLGQPVLSGTSDIVTIAAGRTIDAHVQLFALDPPTIVTVSPDPWVPATTTLSIDGTGFAPRGAHGVTLAGATLAATFTEDASTNAAAPDRATVSPPGDTPGSALVVTTCGVPSATYDLRVVNATAGSAPFSTTPTCPGATVAAVAATDTRLLIAWTCNDTALSALHIHDLTAAACPPPLVAVHPLPAAPTAVAALASHTVVVLADHSLHRLIGPDFATAPETLVAPAGTAVGAASTATGLHVVYHDPDAATPAATTIATIGPTGTPALRPPAFTDLVPLSVGATAETLVLVAATATGESRLVIEPPVGTGAPTASPLDCTDPRAIVTAPDDATLAIRCADATVLWHRATSNAVRLAPSDGIVFDSRSDLVIMATESGPDRPDRIDIIDFIELVALDGTSIARLPTTLIPWLALGAHKVFAVAPGGDTLSGHLLTPFDTDGPCTGATP